MMLAESPTKIRGIFWIPRLLSQLLGYGYIPLSPHPLHSQNLLQRSRAPKHVAPNIAYVYGEIPSEAFGNFYLWSFAWEHSLICAVALTQTGAHGPCLCAPSISPPHIPHISAAWSLVPLLLLLLLTMAYGIWLSIQNAAWCQTSCVMTTDNVPFG